MLLKDFPTIGQVHGPEWTGPVGPPPPAVGNVHGTGLFHVGRGGAPDALRVVWGDHLGP